VVGVQPILVLAQLPGGQVAQGGVIDFRREEHPQQARVAQFGHPGRAAAPPLQHGAARVGDCVQATAAPRQTTRFWSYRSGAALAHLLDRTGTPWTGGVLAGHPLADLLTGQVGSAPPAAPHPDLEGAAQAVAGAHDADLSARLAAFHAQPGPALLLSSPSGLRLGGFDPMNLHAVGRGTFLHARHVQVLGPDAELLTVGHSVLTRGPDLFSVQEVTLRGLPAPTVHGGRWRIRTPTLTVDLPGDAVQVMPDGWSVRLG